MYPFVGFWLFARSFPSFARSFPSFAAPLFTCSIRLGFVVLVRSVGSLQLSVQLYPHSQALLFPSPSHVFAVRTNRVNCGVAVAVYAVAARSASCVCHAGVFFVEYSNAYVRAHSYVPRASPSRCDPPPTNNKPQRLSRNTQHAVRATNQWCRLRCRVQVQRVSPRTFVGERTHTVVQKPHTTKTEATIPHRAHHRAHTHTRTRTRTRRRENEVYHLRIDGF